MRVLVSIAAVCCLCLTGIAVSLWWSIRGRAAAPPEPAPKSAPPVRQRPEHPRDDLAAGMVPGTQAVRPRQRYGVPEPETVAQGPRRTDRAYFSEGGDLSDPDLRRLTGPQGPLSVPEK